MKTSVKIILAIVLFLFLGGIVTLFARHVYKHGGRRYMTEMAMMNRPGRMMAFRQMRSMGPNCLRQYMMKAPECSMQGMGPGQMNGMRRGMGPGQMNGMRRGMGPGQMNGMNRGMGRGLLIRRIPNLTDKQKKEIADLRIDQQAEMKKFREETTARLQSMRKADREQILGLLTPDQKKFLDSKTVKNNSGSSKTE